MSTSTVCICCGEPLPETSHLLRRIRICARLVLTDLTTVQAKPLSWDAMVLVAASRMKDHFEAVLAGATMPAAIETTSNGTNYLKLMLPTGNLSFQLSNP